jgi:type IV pilus assembly protein PilY1
VSPALIRHGRVIFTSVVPSLAACEAGGTSWITELDMLTGAQLGDPIFDVDRDGTIDAEDIVDEIAVDLDGDGDDETSAAPAGIQSEVGIINSPAVISAGAVEHKYTAGSTGELMRVFEAGDASAGRQSWRQLQ